MSTDPVKAVLQQTIKNYIDAPSKSNVIAVNGLWGTGKTHLWQSFFKDTTKRERVYPGIVENIRWVQLTITIIILILVVTFFFSPYYLFLNEFFKANFLLILFAFTLISVSYYLVEYFIYKKAIADIKTYSYVSLFGINTLDDFKLALFQNRVTIKSDRVDNQFLLTPLGYFRKKILPMLSGVNFILFRLSFKEVAYKGFNSLSHTLICIDDLERRGNNLDIKDIMGLVSQLKEQKHCTIVLLYNDDLIQNNQITVDIAAVNTQPNNDAMAEVKEDLQILKSEINQLKNVYKKPDVSKKEFELLLEKVIDRAYTFKPTPKTCLAIALDAYKVKKQMDIEFDGEAYVTLTQAIETEELTNIRVILLILDYLSTLQKEITNPKGRKYFIRPLVRFVCCRYCKLAKYPDWSILKNPERFHKIMAIREENFKRMFTDQKPLEIPVWAESFPNILDLIDNYLINYIETGFLSDRTKLTDVLNDVERMINLEAFTTKLELAKNTIMQFWNCYYQLNKTSADLKRKLDKILASDHDLLLKSSEYDVLVNFVEDLWGEVDGDNLIERYIADWSKYPEYIESYVSDNLMPLSSDRFREGLTQWLKDDEKQTQELALASDIKKMNIREIHNELSSTEKTNDINISNSFKEKVKREVKNIVKESNDEIESKLNRRRYHSIFRENIDEN